MTFKEMAEDFLAQKRIAVAGVSRTKDAAANLIYRKLRAAGHDVFPVNPNAETFDGATCYPSVKAIPGGVDGVVIAARSEHAERIVQDCAEAGIPRVWMHYNTLLPGSMSSVSDAAVAYCREHNIAVIPGGCPLMFMDFGHKCMRWMLGVMGRLPK